MDNKLDPEKAKKRRLALALRQNLAKRKTRVKAEAGASDRDNMGIGTARKIAGVIKNEI